jgi:RimJ/RimL family protein N-acetyltransferase
VIFETPRLQCRRWLPSDVKPLFEVYSDKEGSQWVGNGQPITREECDQWLVVTAGYYFERGYGMFALVDPQSDGVVGFCGLVHPGGQPEVEIKYAFLRSHWGRGLASEAVLALLKYASNALAIDRVMATVAPENLASQRVLEKAGLVLQTSTETSDIEDPTLIFRSESLR